MTTGREAQAHALSLPLYSILDRREPDGSSDQQVREELQLFLRDNHLEEDIGAIFQEDHQPRVGLESRTSFGEAVLKELYTRCDFFPCPDGECEYALSHFCKWCGKLKG